MDHLDHPPHDVWNTRREWFETLVIENGETAVSDLTGTQASALLFELQCCFCAGAWAAVIVLAIAVVESNINETAPAMLGKRPSLSKALNAMGLTDTPIDKLRDLRNDLVHFRGRPALTIDMQYDKRTMLEAQARQAVRLMFDFFKKTT